MARWQIPCGRFTLELGERTLVMGIVNVTPDSFSDGGHFFRVDAAVAHARAMVAAGANIIDVGGESTRPGHTPIEAAEELRRVIPVIEQLADLPVPVSVDTSKALVAQQALAVGATMVNDVWGLLRDPDMAAVVAASGAGVVLMHNQLTDVYTELMADIAAVLRRSMAVAVAAGISAERLILDPGFGFGKTSVHNLDLVRRLAELKALGRPLLVGPSRKGTIGKVLGGLPVDQRLEGTAAVVALSIANGADIVRVHDVREMVRVARMADAVVRPGRGGWKPDEP